MKDYITFPSRFCTIFNILLRPNHVEKSYWNKFKLTITVISLVQFEYNWDISSYHVILYLQKMEGIVSIRY